MQSVLRLWFVATALLLGSALVWSFAPVLVPMLAVAAMLAGFVAAIVAFARWIERTRGVSRGE